MSTTTPPGRSAGTDAVDRMDVSELVKRLLYPEGSEKDEILDRVGVRDGCEFSQ